MLNRKNIKTNFSIINTDYYYLPPVCRHLQFIYFLVSPAKKGMWVTSRKPRAYNAVIASAKYYQSQGHFFISYNLLMKMLSYIIPLENFLLSKALIKILPECWVALDFCTAPRYMSKPTARLSVLENYMIAILHSNVNKW